MKYNNRLLDELHDAIYGNGNEPECDYENQSVNYNTDGDTYYLINTYSNNEVKSIMVCAISGEGKEKISGYREIYVEDDNDIYTAIDYIIEHTDEINMSIDRQMEKQQRRKSQKIWFSSDIDWRYRMKKDIEINNVKLGMVLLDNNGNKFVVIDRNLNGNDDYYSSLKVISEKEYSNNKGKIVSEKDLKTKRLIDYDEYHKDYEICDKEYEIELERVFRFWYKIGDD